jgi:hypothetical protein
MGDGILRLMAVPTDQKDLDWLKASLQAALELELSTLPPYLCGLWSITDKTHPVRKLIRTIVLEEMLHMGLACNMLTAIGGTPEIVDGFRSIRLSRSSAWRSATRVNGLLGRALEVVHPAGLSANRISRKRTYTFCNRN